MPQITALRHGKLISENYQFKGGSYYLLATVL